MEFIALVLLHFSTLYYTMKELERLKREAEDLKKTIKDSRNECGMRTSVLESGPLSEVRKVELNVRRNLRGHLARIYALHWAKDSRNLVSASQDGTLIVWDVHSTSKSNIIPVTCSWIMTCAYSPSGNLVASGGIGSTCSIFSLNNRARGVRITQELIGHKEYMSCCRFIDDAQMLTSSGDKTCCLWDVKTGQKLICFQGHNGDVLALALMTHKVFLSGACDSTAKLWDIRDGICHQTFTGHEGDINAVAMFPNGQAFGTGSDDATCRLFDIRSHQELTLFEHKPNLSGITSVDFSKSGRLLFAGNDDYDCNFWDVLKVHRMGALASHSDRVSCVGMPDAGTSVATGSWDSCVKIWN